MYLDPCYYVFHTFDKHVGLVCKPINNNQQCMIAMS